MGWRSEDGAMSETREVHELTPDELNTVSRFGIHDLDIEADRYERRTVDSMNSRAAQHGSEES